MQLSNTQQIVQAPDVLIQDLEGEAVLLNLANGQYYGLDEIGFRMYNLLITTPSIRATYEKLLEEYDVDPGQLQLDLEKLLDHLLEHGLVITVSGSE